MDANNTTETTPVDTVASDAKVDVKLADLIKNEVFAKELQSYVDSQTGKAVDAYKVKGFQSAVDKGIEEKLKAQQNKTPEQIAIQEAVAKTEALERKLAEKDRVENQFKQKELYRKDLTAKKIPEDFLDFAINDDPEVTKANVSKILGIFESFESQIKQSLLTENNIKVPNKTNGNGTKEPGPTATKEQWMDYYRTTKGEL